MSIILGTPPPLGVVTLDNLPSNLNDTGGLTQLYEVDVRFNVDGTIDINKINLPDILDRYYAPASQTSGLWVRVTVNSGTDLDEVSETRGAWVQLNTQRRYVFSYTSSGGSDTITSNTTVEIATDSGGANVVASKLCTWEVGETI